MDESLQEIIALGLVGLAIGLELLRRWRKRQQAANGCTNCEPGNNSRPPEATPINFYKKSS